MLTIERGGVVQSLDISGHISRGTFLQVLHVPLLCHLSAAQNHDIKMANRFFENVAQFRYLGTTVTNQNLIHEEIKRISY
jgi:hypothetical protein